MAVRKIKRTARKAAKTPKRSNKSFIIRLCHEDGAPLSMPEIRDGFYEAVRKLLQDGRCHRAKRVTIYVTMFDREGSDYTGRIAWKDHRLG
ncbi:MAG: hypothetical protein KJ587_06550 [Alphaproteobacteria bacterium]|nr:hypothetical protein [Alphaproteobacteria bacterium]